MKGTCKPPREGRDDFRQRCSSRERKRMANGLLEKALRLTNRKTFLILWKLALSSSLSHVLRKTNLPVILYHTFPLYRYAQIGGSGSKGTAENCGFATSIRPLLWTGILYY